MEDVVYETRKQKIKKPRSKGQVYSQKHVRIQEKIKAKDSQKQKRK